MEHASSGDMAIFWIVVGLRFIVPLFIPRYPLPAVVAALIIDGVDQSVFQAYTDLPLEGYQGYDKALDIYYLTIAYISTLRNWASLFAFKVSRFLFYWRLVGVVAFELTHIRPLLLIFPNTFEYFFIFYEAVKLRWNPLRMTHKFIIGAAAFIWIFIKLPQEYWIHIAQLDATDEIKALFGLPPTATFSEVFSAAPAVWIGLVVAVVALIALAWWFIKHKLPPADWSLSFDSDAHQPAFSAEQLADAVKAQIERLVSWHLIEKIAMVSLVTVIFAQILPGVRLTNMDVLIGVAFVIVLNTVVSHWFARRGIGWRSAAAEFVVMAIVNFGIMLLFDALWRLEGDFVLSNALVFVLLLTVLVVLYDRYWPVQYARFNEAPAT